MYGENYEGIMEVLSKSSTSDYCGHYVELPFKHAAASEFPFKGYARHHHDDE